MVAVTLLIHGADVKAESSRRAEDLLKDCTLAIRSMDGSNLNNEERVLAASCVGYLSGFSNSGELATESRRTICVPEGVKAGQLVRVFVKYAHDHPDQVHQDKAIVVEYALEAAFPCNKPSK